MTKEQEELVVNNIGLAYFMANKFITTGIEHEELVSICKLGLVKAASKYDESKGVKFNTFATHVMQNMILLQLRYEKKNIKPLYIEDLIPDDYRYSSDDKLYDYFANEVDPFNKLIEHECLKSALDILDSDEKKLIYLYYFKEKKQREIAEIFDVTQTLISRRLVKVINKMKEHLERI